MANVVDSLSIEGLRKSDLKQLLFYINHAMSEGVYYGNLDQFKAREKKLNEFKKKIEDIAFSENDIKIKG
jgi:hypothetical protein